MRHFAADLKARGINVIYRAYNAPDNQGSLFGEVQRAVAQLTPEALIITAPGEFRLLDAMQNWEHELGIPVSILEDDHFLASRNDFANWANGRKQLRMEHFYREMRKKHSVLMESDGPTGSQWNFDVENRRAPPTNLHVPAPYSADPDTITQQVMELIETEFPDHFGDLAPFPYAVTRPGAQEALASRAPIDACMRSLIETGWITFRMRAMLVSFASYQLWLDWRKTAPYMGRLFTDYEPGIHYSQFQMQSGVTGINALRGYNPIKQSRDQDPSGMFIRKWVPELDHLPNETIHVPYASETPLFRPRFNTNYPPPIVDHKVAARWAKTQISEVKKTASFRTRSQSVNQRHGSRKRARAKPDNANHGKQLKLL